MSYERRQFTNGHIAGRTPQSVEDFYGIGYFIGQQPGEYTPFPKNGDYLNPDSKYRFKFQDILSWIGKTVPSGRVLDVASGPGHLAYWAEKLELPYEVISCDAAESVLTSKHNRNPDKSVVSYAHELPFSPSTFDAVLFSDILEHITEGQAEHAVVQAHEMLRPEGSIFIKIPNRITWTNTATLDQAHVWIPTKEEITHLLTEQGFDPNTITMYTRGFPISKFYRDVMGKDLRTPWFGHAIFATAKK